MNRKTLMKRSTRSVTAFLIVFIMLITAFPANLFSVFAEDEQPTAEVENAAEADTETEDEEEIADRIVSD